MAKKEVALLSESIELLLQGGLYALFLVLKKNSRDKIITMTFAIVR
jgi:hypothetical protein